MLRLIAVSVGVVLLGLTLDLPTLAQEPQADSPRKIVNRATPVYPELARKMGLQGFVKLQVTVAPNGTVKFVQAVGGSPLLVQAAENSIFKFRWMPAKQESTELVEMRFHPE